MMNEQRKVIMPEDLEKIGLEANVNEQKYGRLIWIDILRGLGILFVVLGHTRPPFAKFIYGFHMPLFFLLSGFLLSEKKLHMNFKEYSKHCAKSYIIPYFVLSGINLILQLGMLLFNHQLHKEIIIKYIAGILYSRGTVEWMPNCSPLWFLTALFIVLIIYYWIEKSGRYSMVLVVLACAISYALDIGNAMKLPWNTDTALMALVFIFIGHMIKKMRWLEQFYRGKKWLPAIVLFVAGCLGIVLNPIDSVNFDSNHYGNLFWMLIGSLGISLLLLLLCYLYKPQTNNIINKCMAYLGRHTIFIMGFDYFSGTVAGMLLGKLGLQHWATTFVLKMVILLMGLQIWYLIVNRLPWKLGIRLKY